MQITEIIKRYIPHYAEATSHGRLITFEVQPSEIVAVGESLYTHHQTPLKIITAFDERQEGGKFRIMYVFGLPGENLFLAPYIMVDEEFPSLTPSFHEASIYERKIRTFFGLRPAGHPNPRPLILHENWPQDLFPLRKDFDWRSRPETATSDFQFRKLSGEGIYEIPVGPVHAGIIEPGHFRFSVAGEEILLLEPRLGYSHKGSEKLFEVLPIADKIRLAERISGDSSFSHALAFCQALESLSDMAVPEHDEYLRLAFCELERLANHLGDIGAIMTDTGFNFGGAQCGRLREAVMQLNERLTGSRFLRGIVKVGGVSHDIQANISVETADETIAFLGALRKDFDEVIAVAARSNTLTDRLTNAGVLSHSIACDHGVLGVAGKGSGMAADARVDYPYGAYHKMNVEVCTEQDGDVHARFSVRIREVPGSIEMICQALGELMHARTDRPLHDKVYPPTLTRSLEFETESDSIPLKKDAFAIGIVEGWRGDIVYLVATDASGKISRVDVRDPSFLNWTALGYAGQDNMVPDFPLINKSFNLSYSGNDL
ncbi:MAG: NADH-quinone oxidoreductase subunit C [Actinobacteria bacterium]|nr:NADH-quinone oxidoreductase subunit C [Actinomycetota bacterium]